MKYIKNHGAYLLAFATLFVGAMIYVLWRQDTLVYFGWLDMVGLSAPVETMRAYSIPFYPSIPDWMVYSLPNGLWAFSYALLIACLWRDNTSKIKYLWYASVPLLCIGWEMLQFTGTIRGVFCFNDLFLSAAGVGLGMFVGLNHNKEMTK